MNATEIAAANNYMGSMYMAQQAGTQPTQPHEPYLMMNRRGPRTTDTDQSTFEKVYAVYNVAQAGLAYLQKTPGFLSPIFKIQKVLLVTDAIGLGFNLYYLSNRIKEKLKIKPEQEKTYNVIAGISLVAIGALSYIAILKINASLKPAFILKDLLNPEMLKQIHVSWDSPAIHKALQWLSLNRTIASFALSFFSQNRSLNLLSAASQGYTLSALSHLRWLEWSRTIEKHQLKEVFPLSPDFNGIQTMKVKAHFLINSGCMETQEHVRSVLEATRDRFVHLFDQSKWWQYVIVKVEDGIEQGHSLRLWITIPKAPIPSCDCNLTPDLASLSISATDAVYRRVHVLFDWMK
jgi:hypothetical protein